MSQLDRSTDGWHVILMDAKSNASGEEDIASSDTLKLMSDIMATGSSQDIQRHRPLTQQPQSAVCQLLAAIPEDVGRSEPCTENVEDPTGQRLTHNRQQTSSPKGVGLSQQTSDGDDQDRCSNSHQPAQLPSHPGSRLRLRSEASLEKGSSVALECGSPYIADTNNDQPSADDFFLTTVTMPHGDPQPIQKWRPDAGGGALRSMGHHPGSGYTIREASTMDLTTMTATSNRSTSKKHKLKVRMEVGSWLWGSKDCIRLVDFTRAASL